MSSKATAAKQREIQAQVEKADNEANAKPAGSAIINTGSVTGLEGSKELLYYSMTKGGIHAFTKALSGQLVPKGIRVNAVAPGPVWTRSILPTRRPTTSRSSAVTPP